ncbi:MAG: Fic family protein [Planctomycetes bacterium]|nr:Fic family protein [Planctomycetota bacterium]
MVTVRQPPDPLGTDERFRRIVEAFDSDEFRRAMASPLIAGKYLHWDKLRFYKPPEGLSHEQWWDAVKLARLGGRRALPLLDVNGKPFTFILPDTVEELLHKLTLALGSNMRLEERLATKESKDKYLISSLVEEAITSSQLEGAATTRKVAEQMLRSGRKPRDAHEQMIVNNYLAMRRINELDGVDLSAELVFELHRILTEKTLPDEDRGRLRLTGKASDDIAVYDNTTNEVLHKPPAAEELPQRMTAMCAFANGELKSGFVHPIVRAIALHFWLAYDHPFVDGNGRTARALFYWAMKRGGYWLCEYVSISSIIRKAPAKYLRAYLETETDENDLTYFVIFHLQVLDRAVTALESYIQERRDEIQRVHLKLKGVATLNHRQRDLILHAVRHPGQEYTFASHHNSHGVTYQTARSDLLHLEERGLLRRVVRGREFIFLAPPDLESRLAHG